MVSPDDAEAIRECARFQRVPVSTWVRWVLQDALKAARVEVSDEADAGRA